MALGSPLWSLPWVSFLPLIPSLLLASSVLTYRYSTTCCLLLFFLYCFRRKLGRLCFSVTASIMSSRINILKSHPSVLQILTLFGMIIAELSRVGLNTKWPMSLQKGRFSHRPKYSGRMSRESNCSSNK